MPYTPGSIPTSKKRQVSHLFVCLTFYPPSFMWLINIHRAKVGLCDFLYTYCDINETGVVNNCYVYKNGHILILNGEKKQLYVHTIKQHIVLSIYESYACMRF